MVFIVHDFYIVTLIGIVTAMIDKYLYVCSVVLCMQLVMCSYYWSPSLSLLGCPCGCVQSQQVVYDENELGPFDIGSAAC